MAKIEKLDIKNGGVEDLLNCIKKINEFVDAVNDQQQQLNNHMCRLAVLEEHDGSEIPNSQALPCMISTTYMSDTKTKVFCGQRDCAVEFNQPLPAGFIITIKQTKGGKNE